MVNAIPVGEKKAGFQLQSRWDVRAEVDRAGKGWLRYTGRP